MATAQALRQRIQAIKNIKKITTAMKVVATVKLRGAQETLAVSRFFQQSLQSLIKPPAKLGTVKKQLFIGMSSDRGLCGGVNSSISRAVRDAILEVPANVEKGIVLFGDKCRQGLNTQFNHLFQTTLSDCDKARAVTFYQCGELADHWLKHKADKSVFFFQRFKSMIAYVTTKDEFYSYDFLKEAGIENDLALYEREGPDDLLQNLMEFRCAVKLYHYFAESTASTLSARVQAMGNSSTNANDMIASLTLNLNRTRQARITTELSEIVGGAAAVDEETAAIDDDALPRHLVKIYVDPHRAKA